MDFGVLNKTMKKNEHSLLLISEVIDRLSGTCSFTKLDIHKAYQKLWIATGGERKTAFCMCYGHYKYITVLFGLVNAPEAFQSHINTVLCKHLDEYCMAYLDNIVVYSNLLEEHREHIGLVLVKLQ
jgi:hypothetical protein